MLPIEEKILDYLVKNEIYPYSVVMCSEFNKLLKLSFYIESDIDDVLKMIDYKYLSNKSGILIHRNGCTLLLEGFGLEKFLSCINQ